MCTHTEITEVATHRSQRRQDIKPSQSEFWGRMVQLPNGESQCIRSKRKVQEAK